MAQALELFFDEDTDAEVRRRWRVLDEAGVPSLASGSTPAQRPHVTLASGTAIPKRAREALRAELRLLSLPDLWLSTLGTFTDDSGVLFLGAVVDTEILAVHSAVHDVLAGKVTHPAASCFPGAWIPHCVLATDLDPTRLVAGFAALQPPERLRARIDGVAVVDTRTGEIDPLLD